MLRERIANLHARVLGVQAAMANLQPQYSYHLHADARDFGEKFARFLQDNTCWGVFITDGTDTFKVTREPYNIRAPDEEGAPGNVNKSTMSFLATDKRFAPILADALRVLQQHPYAVEIMASLYEWNAERKKFDLHTSYWTRPLLEHFASESTFQDGLTKYTYYSVPHSQIYNLISLLQSKR